MENIGTIKVETSTDTSMTMFICESHTVNEYGVSKPFYELGITLSKNVGEPNDGTQFTTLNESQILRLIGHLLTAKAELEVRNKNRYNNNK